ncbi:SRPBCC family protein [Gluconacetobacter tumulicola]|uniref:SRPBCC domain-containing protein n=1 Tax=Gluconacetobacter tumulicola TaxID=1017177 RepID=A0A7W4JAV9_9PROT|nr:SRPBCC family protein [Gluconacetobacter tumulicola]MBB2177709.1 SRPBCC domain-containing protein [Gluconacetobacter tumulicola]
MYEKSANILIDAPIAMVWDALTSPPLIERYFFGTKLTTDWQIGASMIFRGEYQGKHYEDRGTVLAFEPRAGLSYSYWSSFSGTEDLPEARLVIRYRLGDENGRVNITVTTSNCATEEQADHAAQNWDIVLHGLKTMVESGEGG